MSMSDDEDDEDEGEEDTEADVEDEAVDVFPPPPPPPQTGRTRASSFVLPPPAPLPRGDVATTVVNESSHVSPLPVDEEEDCVLPPAAMTALTQTFCPSKPRTRSRRSTLESWFPPLANFIDLKDEELSSWRGVVEIVNGL